jgi:long-subunit fatty acid transport protein
MKVLKIIARFKGPAWLACGLLVLAVGLGAQQESDIAVAETNFSGVVGSGARAIGMGGAFIAIADDATAASWNPGGLGQLEKPEFTLVGRHQNYQNMLPASGDGLSLFGALNIDTTSYGFDFISFTYPFRIGKLKIVPQVSYQRAISFNLESTQNDVQFVNQGMNPQLQEQVIFRGTFIESQVFKGGLDTVSFSVGARLFKRFNIGVSANLWLNGYEGELQRHFTGELYLQGAEDPLRTEEDSSFELFAADIKGVNVNIGVLVDVTDKLKIGAVYKSTFKADMEYSWQQERGAFFGGEDGGTERRERDGKSTLEWPETWGLGFSYRPIDALTISIDFTKTSWSKSILRNFQLPPRPGEGEGQPGEGGGQPGTGGQGIRIRDVYFPTLIPVNSNVTGGFEQFDTRQVRVGIEYVFIGKNVLVPLRLGFFTDSQYYSDSSGEEITFLGVTGGLGLKWGKFSMDLAVLLETGSYLRDNLDFAVTRFSEIRSYLSLSYSF